MKNLLKITLCLTCVFPAALRASDDNSAFNVYNGLQGMGARIISRMRAGGMKLPAQRQLVGTSWEQYIGDKKRSTDFVRMKNLEDVVGVKFWNGSGETYINSFDSSGVNTYKKCNEFCEKGVLVKHEEDRLYNDMIDLFKVVNHIRSGEPKRQILIPYCWSLKAQRRGLELIREGLLACHVGQILHVYRGPSPSCWDDDYDCPTRESGSCLVCTPEDAKWAKDLLAKIKSTIILEFDERHNWN